MACTCLNTTIGRDFPLTSRGLLVPPPNEEPRNTGNPVGGSRSENHVQKHAVLYSRRNSSCMRGSYRELCSASPELLGELLLLDTHTQRQAYPLPFKITFTQTPHGFRLLPFIFLHAERRSRIVVSYCKLTEWLRAAQFQ